jgi:choline-sulfatase
VDIAPTILQVTRVAGDRQVPMQGRGLLGPMLGKRAAIKSVPYAETLYPRSTFGWSDLTAYIEGRFKYINAPRPELYDLQADPGEKVNLYEKQRTLADSLRQQMNQFKQRVTASNIPAPSAADQARIEPLRALGYVAVAVPVKPRTGTAGLADPKDKVHIFNKVLLAMQASDAGALARSNALLEEVIREEPDLFIAHYSIGVNELKSGDFQKALQHFEKADSLNPSFELTELNRATALSRLGRVDEAISLLRALLKGNPSRLEPRRQLGLLYTRQKNYEKAVSAYRDILREHPGDPQATKFLGIALVDAGSYQDGLVALQQAITLGANDALTYNSLGIAQANLGKPQEAVASYRKALLIKSDYHQARLNLSFALLKTGQARDARAEFDRLCRESAALCQQYRSYFPK